MSNTSSWAGDPSRQIDSAASTRQAFRGGAVNLSAQMAKFFIGLALTAVLARLLTPADYGLVAMVAVVTGLIAIFKDAGLTIATVQQAEITHEQVSTLFWINLALGACLALLLVFISPLIASFYQDARLVPITAALALPFLFGGMAAQPTALLQRSMRFGAIAAIEIVSLVLSGAVGVAAAVAGWGAWALVTMTVTSGAASAALAFVFCRWRPSRPSRGSGVRSMLRFGGALTVNRLIEGLASSLDVLLLGRFYSPASVGLYVRSQGLMLQPLTQLMSPLQSAALPFFSRLASAPERLDRAFIDLLMVTAVAASFFTVFIVVGADWLVLLFLGANWVSAAPIVQFFAGAMLSLPLTSACVLLLISQGRGALLVRWSLIKSPVLMTCILLGMPWGPEGVALALSAGSVFVLWPILTYLCAIESPAGFARIWAAGAVAFLSACFGVVLLYYVRVSLELEEPILGLAMLSVANLTMHVGLACGVPSCRRAFSRGAKLAYDSFRPTHE